MKKAAAAMISVTIALTMAACANNETEAANESTLSQEEASSVQTDSVEMELITTDGSDIPELEQCLADQLTAISNRDFEAFKQTLDAPLMAEVLVAVSEQNGEQLPDEEITDESLAEMTNSIYENLCASFAQGFDSSILELTVQTDSLPTAGCRIFSATFKTINMINCYATVYEKDGRWGAVIETDDTLQSDVYEILRYAADTNASLIGRSAKRAIEEYGAIPDGEYIFDVVELKFIAEPKNALEAFQSAVAKAFDFDSESDEGETFLLVRNGEVYAQWRSLANPEIVGEYPTHEEDGFAAVWGSPSV